MFQKDNDLSMYCIIGQQSSRYPFKKKKTRGVSTFWSTDSRRSWPTVLQLLRQFPSKIRTKFTLPGAIKHFWREVILLYQRNQTFGCNKVFNDFDGHITLLISLKLTPCRRQKILPVHYLICPILPVHYLLGQRVSQCWSIYPFIII